MKLAKMGVWAACASATGCALLCVLPLVQSASAQTVPPTFDSRLVESATAISGRLCTNSAIGISYQFPEGMKLEDATAMREFAIAGSANQGIGPEARYFLYGYREANTVAMLCGGSSKDGQVQVMAMSLSALQSAGPQTLEQLVQGVGEMLNAKPSLPRRQTISGTEFLSADAETEITSPESGKVKLRGTTFAAQINAYVVMWNLVGYSEEGWKKLVAGMDSIKISVSQPITASARSGSGAPAVAPPAVPSDFRLRLDAFLKVWITDRDRAKAMAFIDSTAYTAPPFIGTYCDGWYRKDTPALRVAQTVAQNLMGFPEDFPKGTTAAAIFKAWDRLPPQWLVESGNNVATDHFLIVRLDAASLGRIFSGIFARSSYGKFLESKIQQNGSTYWAVFPELFPDGDIFVIFTLWQKSTANWNVVHIDVICQ